VLSYTTRAPALQRQQRGDDGGSEQAKAKGWKAMVIRVKAKIKQWQVQIHKYYLSLMRRHVALTTKLAFRYIRVIAFTIGVSLRAIFRKPPLPKGATTVFAHDRRDTLFRRGAVQANFRESRENTDSPRPVRLGNGGPVSRRPTNQYLFFQT